MTYNPQFIRRAFHPGFIGPAPTPTVPVLLSADSFNRAGPSLGSTDGAGSLDPLAWTNQVGSQVVSGNHLTPAITGSGIHVSTVPLGVADANIQIVVGTPTFSGQTIGLVFRYTDSSNYLFAVNTATTPGVIEIWKRSAGVETMLGTTTGFGSATITLGVAYNGSSIVASRNGVDVLTVSSTFNLSATICGCYGNDVGAGGTLVWDDWAVYTV